MNLVKRSVADKLHKYLYFGRNDFILTPAIEVKSVRTPLLGD